jgi:hypothetical protein
LAIAEARRLATESLDSLRAPQDALRAAAADYIESVAKRRIDASRHASAAVMEQLSDDDIIELRFWAEEQVALVLSRVENDIASCDFWIPDSSGLSLIDVNTYAGALVPRPKDSKTGIPQPLVFLFGQCLQSLRHGLGVVGLTSATAEAEPHLEAALVRRWRTYREKAVDCIITWADIDERYQISAARFQEVRWEVAGQADFDALRARRAAEDSGAAERPEASDTDEPLPDAPERVTADAIVRSSSERLAPVGG